MREAIAVGAQTPDAEALAERFARDAITPRLTRVVNASGVILHTGLGRARLARQAVDAMVAAASGHCGVEIDLQTGKRGDRQSLVRDQLCQLTGSESALVVNNCAAAVLLALTAIAKGGEVLLSMGQMVEIGGSFRMPDIVRRAGCKLVGVGCTNKVRLTDYEEAITPKTRAILRCHPSNYRVVGFVEEPNVEELAALARKHALPLVDDVGSGCLVDTTAFGLPREAVFGESLRAGANVSMASGDKLLGGPQAGLIVGDHGLIAQLAKHPLARALRIDKVTLAALSATLQMYLNGQEAEIPTIRYLGRPQEEVKADATTLASAYPKSVIAEGITEVGGGSLPGTGVPTWRCGLHSGKADALARALRMGVPAIVARIEKGVVWLDPRTMDSDEVAATAARLRELA